ncbi:MAG TPA: DoxX family protein [Gemmatimonadales bacterium]|nr:DoxX family protein [Gemmatimonadales bacterium]
MPDDHPLRNALRLSWVAQIIAAVILGQSLFFKFTGAPEAVYIFERLGVEPWGRYATGIVELVTVVLLLIPRTAGVGALLAIGLMVGAVGSHLTVLGINVQGDGGTLFGMAIVTLIAAVIVARIRRKEIPMLGGSRG